MQCHKSFGSFMLVSLYKWKQSVSSVWERAVHLFWCLVSLSYTGAAYVRSFDQTWMYYIFILLDLIIIDHPKKSVWKRHHVLIYAASWNSNDFELCFHRGSFEICDEFCHTDFYEEIEAHRPIIVSPKVCEVSKQMPKKLPFKLISRLDVWPRIFLKGCPTANDIALYFLPREVYRFGLTTQSAVIFYTQSVVIFYFFF